jgi:hypothetical protein
MLSIMDRFISRTIFAFPLIAFCIIKVSDPGYLVCCSNQLIAHSELKYFLGLTQ